MIKRVVGLAFLLIPQIVLGYSFRPTAAEFHSWPDYCKSKYVVTNIGESSPFRREVSSDMLSQAKSMLGDQTWTNIHHGCAGFIWINRAERLRGKNPRAYQAALISAKNEASYSNLRTPSNHPMSAKLKTVLARVAYHEGNKTAAMEMFADIIRQSPKIAEPYAVLSTYLFREGKMKKAREVLEQGMVAVERPTAEMHYFLGLVLLRQKAYSDARTQAEEAYRLGYPLPGLKRKLKSVGHWDT